MIRKPVRTKKIEVRNNMGFNIMAKCVVTAEGNLYIDIDYYDPPERAKEKNKDGIVVHANSFAVIPIEEVDF